MGGGGANEVLLPYIGGRASERFYSGEGRGLVFKYYECRF